jgi:hypothetical protein
MIRGNIGLKLINMKEINKVQLRVAILFAIVFIAVLRVSGQNVMPDELIKSPLKEQINYIQVKTRIFENYRAIREDMFQKLVVNINDTLLNSKTKIAGLNTTRSTLLHSVDSLNSILGTTRTNLDEMIITKNSIRFLGLEINKITYNTILWTIIGGLLVLLATGFLVFKRNLAITVNTKNELKELKEEFEAYRKTTREAREKASMDHFNELKKLKGGN